MKKETLLDDEKEGLETGCFTLTYVKHHQAEVVEIHEIDMEGWTLFECFVLPVYDVHYFSWNEETARPEWINMDDGFTEDVELLAKELWLFKTKAAS